MVAVEKIKEIVLKEGYSCSVELSPEGKVVCVVDGSSYTPFDAADKFVAGGWGTVWQDR